MKYRATLTIELEAANDEIAGRLAHHVAFVIRANRTELGSDFLARIVEVDYSLDPSPGLPLIP